MRITPLDVQKHRFARALRGYDEKEVRAFLATFAEQLESVVRESHEQREEIAVLREQLREHQERERILKDTLLTAQAAAQDVREVARREAEGILKDAELRAEKMLQVARDRIGELEGRIVDLRSLRRGLASELEGVLRRHAGLLEDWSEDQGPDNLQFLDGARRLADD